MKDYPYLNVTITARWLSLLDEVLAQLPTSGWQTGDGDPVCVTIYFTDERTAREVHVELPKGLSLLGVPESDVLIESGSLEESDWEAEWRKSLHPLRIGRRWLVRPSWQTSDGYADRTTLVIDPKMAFGSGTHPTTALCLVELESLVKPGVSVLDVGTGTGILAMGAAHLGASPITAVEIDADAVRCARENLVQNQMASRIRLELGSLDVVPGVTVDLIVANIQYNPLTSMSAELRQRLNPGGQAVFSGILSSEGDAFQRAMESFGWQIFRRRRQFDPVTSDGWECFCAK